MLRFNFSNDFFNHVIYGVVKDSIDFSARFNGLTNERLQPMDEKDVKTPCLARLNSVHIINDVVNGDDLKNQNVSTIGNSQRIETLKIILPNSEKRK